MTSKTFEFLKLFFDQIEKQVQFGDTKAQLLVAGDAILLATNGGLIKITAGCPGDNFVVECMKLSPGLLLAAAGAVFLTAGLTCALLAARPAKIHKKPPSQLLLFSYIATIKRDDFAEKYLSASDEDLIQEALVQIHGKAVFATGKFRLLRNAIDATLMGLGFMVVSLAVAVVGR